MLSPELTIGVFNMSVLIDNSIYHSFRAAMDENALDAHTVYNMANFIECLVISDRIFLAPTIHRSVDQMKMDPLFQREGLCIELENVAQNDADAKLIFTQAIKQSLDDLSRESLLYFLGMENVDLAAAQRVLQSWQQKVDVSSQGFMETYSRPVYVTDLETSKLFDKVFPGYRELVPVHEHLAHYLLRCNVALQLSEGLVYHPHSYRTPLICEKLNVEARQSASLISELVRYTESRIEDRLSIDNLQVLRRYWMAYASDLDMPLILSVVLSGARGKDDIIPLTLELRNTAAAQRYRELTSNFVSAIRGEIPKDRMDAECEMQAAKQVLSKELTKLYGVHDQHAPSRLSRLFSVVSPTELASSTVRSTVMQLGKKILKSIPEGADWTKKMRMRRKVTLLLNLAKRRRDIPRLNTLLERVFHKKLSPDQMHSLDLLRRSRGRLITALGSKGN